jgi:hypothetical protein
MCVDDDLVRVKSERHVELLEFGIGDDAGVDEGRMHKQELNT